MHLKERADRPDSDPRPTRLPLFLSALVFPGAGQFAQRRWVAGALCATLFTASFAAVVVQVVRLLLANLSAASAFLSGAANRPFASLRMGAVLLPLSAGILVYLAGLVDVWLAYRRRCRSWTARRLRSRLSPSAGLLVLLVSVLLVARPVAAGEIHRAVVSDDRARVERILARDGDQVLASIAGEGATPLHLAAALDLDAMTAFLVARGADTEARTVAGFTPLHWAASRDATQAAEMLILLGADVNAEARNGITPLHWAAHKNATNAVELLLSAGAHVVPETKSGLTPLHWSVRKNALESSLALAATIVAKEMDGIITNPPVSLPGSEPTAAWTPPPAAAPAAPGGPLDVPIGPAETLPFVWIADLGIWVGRTEITNGQFRRFNPTHNSLFYESHTLNEDDQPAVYVSWDQARAFCAWLNTGSGDRLPPGWRFRLPTEAEWTACARCGDRRRYPWGDGWPPAYGNFSDLTARKELPDWQGIAHYDDGYVVTCPVSQSGTNEWGLLGLAGNVWEWCLDWYDEPHRYKTRRGAAWDFDTEADLRVEHRGFDRPDARYDTIGFRVVAAPDAG